MIAFIRIVLLLISMQLPVQLPIPTFEPLASPTPIPTLEALQIEVTVEVPHSYIYNGLATVEAGLAQAPADLTNPGLPVLPGTQGGELFGYIKWIFATNIAYEVFGRFGDIVVHLAARLTLIMFLTGIALLITLVTFVLRFVVWIVYKIRAIFP
jgi:hypothetical protein